MPARPHRSARPALVGLLLIAGVGGCTDSTLPADPFPRVGISGTVSLDGAPLPTGMIQFDPASGTTGPAAAGEITDGKFAITKPQGPVAGKYKVSISGKPPVKIAQDEQPGGAPKLGREPIPARYNTQSTLETEIPASGTSTLDFALKK